MAKTSFSFPQIYRLFSATVIWLLLIGLVAFNILAKRAILSASTSFIPLQHRPFSSQAHLTYAQTLWSNGQAMEAKREAHLASDLSSNDSVLGASTQADALLSTWASAPAKTEHSFETWKKITVTHPDYADAFLRAAVYAYQLGNKIEAQRLIKQALILNPTSTSIGEFAALMN